MPKTFPLGGRFHGEVVTDDGVFFRLSQTPGYGSHRAELSLDRDPARQGKVFALYQRPTPLPLSGRLSQYRGFRTGGAEMGTVPLHFHNLY